LLNLLIDQPIFIGFKAAGGLRLMIESLAGADKKYVSSEDSTFLRTCRIGDDLYIGKLIHDPLTTDRVEDIRRNILSILRKIGPSVRLPTSLRILACRADDEMYVGASASSSPEDEMSMPHALVR
jgi:hypothetical protein